MNAPCAVCGDDTKFFVSTYDFKKGPRTVYLCPGHLQLVNNRIEAVLLGDLN